LIFDEFGIEAGTPEDVALAVVYPHVEDEQTPKSRA
jgi:hypothetical protein